MCVCVVEGCGSGVFDHETPAMGRGYWKLQRGVLLFFLKIIPHSLAVWIKKTKDEKGFGGKSLIRLKRIPTLSHTTGPEGCYSLL